MTPEIRSATPDDVPAIDELLDGLDETHRIGAPWLFVEPASPPRPSGYFEEYLLGDTHAALVAVAGSDGVVGVSLGLLRSTPEFSVFRRERFGVLDGLAVASSFRRRGIGAHLVRATEEWARSKGAAWLELGVHEFNEDARRFYEALGFDTYFRKLRKPFTSD
ncbi:MAG TPA: GNAT family N-acetyltransferase [Polyangiaceae bacterium]|jgi:ribosomal protein S18 acetylase RimI-like enzyme|nr:GNAT family N-acetyltransferase [Polyangiaceae bacterium]